VLKHTSYTYITNKNLKNSINYLINFMNKFVKFAGAFLFACTVSSSFAKVVDETTAKTVGSNFLMSTYPNGIVKGTADLTTAYVAQAQANGRVVVDYYVFDINGGTGFVMVSADDNIIPILAYSSESSFDINTINPSAKDWIEGYQNQITAAITHSLPAQAGTSDRWNELKQGVPAQHVAARKTASLFPSSSVFLVQTTWNQAAPTGNYNQYCPGGSYTGCVATAMAQVMKYWNWPTVGAGSHTYTQSPNTSGYPAQTVDFGNTAYNWADMSLPAHLTGSDANVATLMYHCGVSTDMDYSTSESGTYVIQLESTYKTNCAEFALKTFFHYKRSTLRGVPRYGESGSWPNDPIISGLSPAAWINMLKAELDASRPVLYSGSGSDGGHNWVCDGYDASGNMHFNFGWSAQSDGYYSVDAIAPPALGYGGGGSGNNFNADQCAIIGIQPDSFATLTGSIEMNSRLDWKPTTPASFVQYTPAAFTVTATILNSGTSSFSGDFCAQVFDTNFVYVGTINTITGQTVAAGTPTASLSFSPSATLYQMIPGPYNIRIMYRPTGTTAWMPVANNGTFYNENLIHIENTAYNHTLSTPSYDGLEVAAPLAIAGGSTTLKTSKPFSLSTQIQNQTQGSFNGSIQAVLTNVVTGTVTSVQLLTGQSIFYSGTSPYTFSGTVPSGLAAGTYTLAIQHQPGGTGAFVYTGSDFYENPIVVNVVSAAGITTTSAIAEKITVYPNPSNDVINIAIDGVAVSKILITDIQGREVQSLIPGNQSLITIPVSNYAAGMYFVNLYSGEEVVTKKIVVAK
jgi:hypothetical protein